MIQAQRCNKHGAYKAIDKPEPDQTNSQHFRYLNFFKTRLEKTTSASPLASAPGPSHESTIGDGESLNGMTPRHRVASESGIMTRTDSRSPSRLHVTRMIFDFPRLFAICTSQYFQCEWASACAEGSLVRLRHRRVTLPGTGSLRLSSSPDHGSIIAISSDYPGLG